jgi:hypothetical protein
MSTTPATLPDWVLNEPVDVTQVYVYPDAEINIYLIARTTRPGAITLTFDEDRVLVNGIYLPLDEDLVPICSLIEDAYGALQNQPNSYLAFTVRTSPFSDSDPRFR